MKIKCPVCVPCTDPSEPVANYSTEDADYDHVFCYGSANGGNLPGAGRNWNVGDCTVMWGPISCYSIDEEGCQSCVQATFWNCETPPGPEPVPCMTSPCVPPVPPPIPPVPPPPSGGGHSLFTPERVTYWNNAQTATLDCPDGSVFEFTTLPFRFFAFSQATADAAALSYAKRQVRLKRVCLGELFDWMCDGETLDGEFIEMVHGAFPPYVFSVVGGQVPPGLDIDSDGFVSGTATQAGVFTFTVRATGTNDEHGERTYTIDVFGASNEDPLPDAKCDIPYTCQLEAVGGQAPFTFTPNPAFPLPAGLTIDFNGLISGTLAQLPSSFYFRVIIEDSTPAEEGGPRRCSPDFTLTLTGPKFLNAPVDGAECTAYGPLQILTSPTPCTFSGGCPGSLVISAGGIISGIPHVRGAETFVLTAVDADGNTNTQTTTVNFTSSGGSVTAVGEMVWTGEFTVATGTCNFSAYHVGGRVIYDIDFPVAVRSMLISTISFPRSNLRRCIGEPGYDIRIVSLWTVGANVNGSITQNQVDVAGQFIYSSPSGPPAIGGAQDVTLPAAGWPAAGGQTDFQFAIQNGPALGPWDVFHAHYEITITPFYPP